MTGLSKFNLHRWSSFTAFGKEATCPKMTRIQSSGGAETAVLKQCYDRTRTLTNLRNTVTTLKYLATMERKIKQCKICNNFAKVLFQAKERNPVSENEPNDNADNAGTNHYHFMVGEQLVIQDKCSVL